MPTPTAAERAYVERLGLFFEAAGATRMVGRLFAWLLICDPPQQSITELAAALSVSKASVSTVIRQMRHGQMVQRLAIPGSRQHYYRLRSGSWTQLVQGRVALTTMAIDALNDGLVAVGDDPARQERLAEVRDFFEFMAKEYSEELLQRWERYRQDRRAERERLRDTGQTGRLPASLAAARKANADPPD